MLKALRVQLSGSRTTDSDDGGNVPRHWGGSLKALAHCCSANELPDLAIPCSDGPGSIRQPGTQQMPKDVVINVHGTYAPGAFLLLQVSVSAERLSGSSTAPHADAAGKCIDAAASYGLQAASLSAANVVTMRLYHMPDFGLDGPVYLHGRRLQPQAIPVLGIIDSSRKQCVVLLELLARTS